LPDIKSAAVENEDRRATVLAFAGPNRRQTVRAALPVGLVQMFTFRPRRYADGRPSLVRTLTEIPVG